MFLMNFEVFYLLMNHFVECLILLHNKNDFRRENEQFFICFLNSHKTFNPFAPEPPKIALQIHVLSIACNVMSFNDQRQSRYYRSCARWRKLSNHTWAQFSEGYQRKRPKKYVTLTWKFPWKSCSTTHLPFCYNLILSSYTNFSHQNEAS